MGPQHGQEHAGACLYEERQPIGCVVAMSMFNVYICRIYLVFMTCSAAEILRQMAVVHAVVRGADNEGKASETRNQHSKTLVTLRALRPVRLAAGQL